MDDLLTSSHGIVHLKSFDLIAPNMEKSALPMPLLEKSEALPANVYIRQEVKPGKGMEEIVGKCKTLFYTASVSFHVKP